MPDTVTIQFQGRQHSRGVNGWTASQTYSVIGVTTEYAAASALASASPPVTLNSAYPSNRWMKCDNISATSVNPTMWTVTATYSIPKSGGEHPGGTEDPEDQPWIYEYRPGLQTEAVDRDINGNPLVNSAGDPPPPGAFNRDFTTLEIAITRNEPAVPTDKIQRYLDAYNRDTVDLAGLGSYDPYTIRCVYLGPASTFNSDALFIPIRYAFRYDPDGYWHRFEDKGQNGWFDDGGNKQGVIVDGNGVAVTTDKLLDGTGKPLDATLKIGSQKAAPIANPNGTPSGATLDTTNPDVVYLKYRRYEAVDFADILN